MTEKDLTENELTELEREVRSHPATWAYWQLSAQDGNPWKARWYQREILDDLVEGEKRVTVRMGRRVGKTDTMIIHLLWKAVHEPNSRLLVVAPYERQIDLIFMRISELAQTSDDLKNSIKITKSPFTGKLNNGSVILGFTAGANAGSQAGASTRGQRANFIYIDEVDYMSVDGIEAVTSIALESEDIGIWMSSTPTGKREYFYKTFEYPEMGYKGYHYPSHVNPNFTEKMDQQAKASMTKEAYEHEILAEFGTEAEGVFNKEFIDKAVHDYLYAYRKLSSWEIDRYKSYKYDMDNLHYTRVYKEGEYAPPGIRMIGVDWDKLIVHFKSDLIDKIQVNCKKVLRANMDWVTCSEAS